MKTKHAELLLAAVIIARSTSYLFSKVCLETIEPFTLLSIRFTIALAILIAIYWKKIIRISKKDILYGSILGLTMSSFMIVETLALKTTDSSMVALLENTFIIIVPIIIALKYKKIPSLAVIISIAVSFTGVILLNYKGGSFHLAIGEMLSLLSAMIYGLFIILTGQLSKKSEPLLIGIVQIATLAVLSTIISFIIEVPALPKTSVEWTSILVLAIVCTVFGYTFQPIAQKNTSMERANIFCGLNPVSATLLGAIFMGETLSPFGILGAFLIVLSLYISGFKKKKDKKRKIKTVHSI